MTGQLLAHVDTRHIERRELGALPMIQPQGKYHAPIPHVELVETLEHRIEHKLNANVEHEEFSINNDKTKLFGLISFSYGEQKDLMAAVGFRHALDRSMSIQMVAGMQVFVCDNMCLRGDFIFLREKHDVRTLNLASQIDVGLDEFIRQYATLAGDVAGLKRQPVTMTEGKAFILDAYVEHRVMPPNTLTHVVNEWTKPTRPEFQERTAWSLYNSFTQIAKSMAMRPRQDATMALAKLMGLSDESL